MTEAQDQAARELEEAQARLHEENMAAIRAARAAVREFTGREWPRVRCPVCGRGTIAVRGVLVAHQAGDGIPLPCPGSGGPLPPRPEARKGDARE